jgi:hypothetical protein
MEQAAFYTNKDEKKKAKPNRKVVLSTSLAVQAQILLTGDDEDDIQDEAYETWEEEMLEDDDDDQGEKEDAENKADEEEQEKQKDPIKNSNKLDENGKDIKPERNNREEQQQMAANQSSSARVDPPVALQKDNIPNRVLRVYAGNVSVNASYHSVRVVESTTAAELLQQAMEKFRISEIESQQGASGLNDNSCVEYYLTIKQKDGDEITMEGKDKPWEIFESLTDHLTTPMPSLTKFRQLASSNTSINSTSSSKKKKKYHNMDHSIQFLMNKRIKRVNEKNGQVHIKVSLITPSVSLSTLSYSSIIGRNAIKKMTQFRRFTKKNKGGGASGNSNVGAITEVGERIDKLIAIPENISIADLTTTALVKFHILSEMNQPHQYRMVLQCDGKGIYLLIYLYLHAYA